MKQKLNSLLMKMNIFFTQWDQLEDLNKYSEYDIARKMINVIEKEAKKKEAVKAKLSIVKSNE